MLISAAFTIVSGAAACLLQTLAASAMRTLFQSPLSTQGRYVVDAAGARFKLASVNWYGASDEHWIPGGLDICHRDEIARTILDLGFNSVRLPYSDEMIYVNPIIPLQNGLQANPDLADKHALDIFHAVVESLTEAGVTVIVNNHITEAKWCDGMDLTNARWSNSGVPFARVKQPESQWLENWRTIMRPHVDNPNVIGADLRNEIRLTKWKHWATVAEEAGNMLHALNPHWLIIVEGVNSAGDLRGVKTRPIKLHQPNRVVYSAHAYKWFGWGQISQYGKLEYPDFAKLMHKNWGYLLDDKASLQAPVWIGEFGAPTHGDKDDHLFWSNLMQYMYDRDVDFGYWAINTYKPAGRAHEPYSILDDTWTTAQEDYRMHGMRRLMQPLWKGTLGDQRGVVESA